MLYHVRADSHTAALGGAQDGGYGLIEAAACGGSTVEQVFHQDLQIMGSI